MDLGTIQKRIDSGYYYQLDEVLSDIKLVFSNCKTFNQDGSDIVSMCNRLEEIFNKKLPEKPQNPAMSFSSAGKKRSADDSAELHEYISIPITSDEKLALGGHINNLSEDQQMDIIKIITESRALSNNGGQDDEFEVDIDTLDNATLRRLQHHCGLLDFSKLPSRKKQAAPVQISPPVAKKAKTTPKKGKKKGGGAKRAVGAAGPDGAGEDAGDNDDDDGEDNDDNDHPHHNSNNYGEAALKAHTDTILGAVSGLSDKLATLEARVGKLEAAIVNEIKQTGAGPEKSKQTVTAAATAAKDNDAESNKNDGDNHNNDDAATKKNGNDDGNNDDNAKDDNDNSVKE